MKKFINEHCWKLISYFKLFLFIASLLGWKKPRENLDEIKICEKKRDEKSIKTLLKYLDNKDERVKIEAIFAVGIRTCCGCPNHLDPTEISKLQDKRILKKLLSLLKDKSPIIRNSAVMSLYAYKSPEIVEPLIEVLNDKEGNEDTGVSQYPVGVYAAYILGKINDKRAVEPLVKAIKSDDKDICHFAMDALRDMNRYNRVREEISKMTPEIISDLRSNSSDKKILAIGRASEFGVSEAIPILNKLLSEPDIKIRIEAASTLCRIGDESSIPFMQEICKDSNPEIKKKAWDFLSRKRNKTILPDLLKALEGNDKKIKESAIYYLRFYDEPEVIQPLVNCVLDKDIKISRAAIYILGDKFFKNIGDLSSHKEIVPKVIEIYNRIGKSDGICYSIAKILIACDDPRGLPVLYNEFKRKKDAKGIPDNILIINRKIADFLIKFGDENQKNEAMEYLAPK